MAPTARAGLDQPALRAGGGDQRLGKHVFKVAVTLGSLDPGSLRVELYANVPNGEPPLHLEMQRGEPLAEGNGYTYSPRCRPCAPPRTLPFGSSHSTPG